jgi:hypothetical protein
MTLKPWTLAAICLCILIIGVFLGRLLAPGSSSSNPQNNTITVDVENGSGKINLAPRKNDVIKWVDQVDKAVKVKFLTDSPCKELHHSTGTTDTCTVEVERGSFQYVCDGSPACVDPGVDPRSNSGLLARSGPPVAPSPAGFVTASISCPNPNGPPVVTWSPDPPGSSVNVNENIIFKGGSLNFTVTGFTYQNHPIQLCSQSTVNESPVNHTCTLVKDPGQTPPYMVTYTVTTSGERSCGSASPTLTVNPASPTAVPTGKG